MQLPDAELSELRILSCENCGAQVEYEPNIRAAECPYCATPVVTVTGTARQIKPRGLLPFKLTEDKARNATTNWLGRLWFAPRGLQEYARKGRSGSMQGERPWSAMKIAVAAVFGLIVAGAIGYSVAMNG